MRNDRKPRYSKLREMKYEVPRSRFDPTRRSGKLIREIVANSRIYLPLWRVFPGEVLQRRLRDRPSEEGHGTLRAHPRTRPRYLRFGRCRNILRTQKRPKFPGRERSFLCVAIKGFLKRRFRLAADPILFSPSAIGTTMVRACEPL